MATRMSSNAQTRAEQLVALPSLSSALSSLPHAKSLDHVALHQPTLASRAAESEAKLRKALSVTSQNSANGRNPAALAPVNKSQATPPNCPSPPPLMMRPQLKSKLRT